MNQQKKEKGKSATLPAEKAVQCIRNYYAETERDGHARYLSWQHCYQAFCRYRDPDNQEAVDYLALHLAFYLASWGMYRGSSFLLQKDYKVHIPVVEMILKRPSGNGRLLEGPESGIIVQRIHCRSCRK